MADRGIIFSAPMVRALLAGTKTQTRRLLNPQPSDYPCASNPPAIGNIKKHAKPYFDRYHKGPFWCWWDEYDRQGPDWIRVPHAPGDRLYVREGWSHTGQGVWDIATARMTGRSGVIFMADGPKPGAKYWPSIHMPREFSRLTLLVIDVRVQRLQDISEADAIAEGIEARGMGSLWGWIDYLETNPNLTRHFADPLRSYASLWNSLHTDPGTRWEDNPWIYAVSFDVRHGNIDQIA